MGEQAWIEAGQSLLLAQTEHVPRTHRGLAVGHPSSLAHSTQPSVGVAEQAARGSLPRRARR